MAVTLRRARAEDVPAIAVLTRQAYAKWVGVIGREPKPMQADYAEAFARHRFDVFEAEGRIVALIETMPQVDSLLIVNLAVAPGHQGKGLGARLLLHAEDLAREAALPAVRLYTNQRFSENLGFYARRGYVAEREETLAFGIVIHMIKTLAPPR